MAKYLPKTQETLISQIKEKYGDLLDCSLIEYKGTILLVCHEPEFYRDVVTDIWTCEEWTTKVV